MYNYTKINGNGNNFLTIDNRNLKLSDDQKSKLALRDCNINSSIGADGILYIEESDSSDFTMRIYNSDGSEAQMCGNGARCIAQYAYDKGIAKKQMVFETKSGMIKAEIKKDKVGLDMGLIGMETLEINNALELDGKKIIYNYLLLGVPHVVIYCDENKIITKEQMYEIGTKLSRLHKVFPEGTNVNFVKIKDNKTIEVITYERGVYNFTHSCGTGSCASGIISGITKGLDKEIEVHNPGGINTVRYDFSQDKMLCHVILSGSVQTVANIQMLI